MQSWPICATSRPWLQPPSSPGWLAAANRAAKGIARLLAQTPAA